MDLLSRGSWFLCPLLLLFSFFFKFNTNCVARGKPELVGIRGVLHNGKGEVLFQFSKYADVKDPNEVEVMAI